MYAGVSGLHRLAALPLYLHDQELHQFSPAQMVWASGPEVKALMGWSCVGHQAEAVEHTH